jgi:hypothetical protein
MHSVTGEATRKGFYVYDEKRKASPDPELKKYIEKSRSISGVTIDPKVSLSLSLLSLSHTHTHVELIIILYRFGVSPLLLSWRM